MQNLIKSHIQIQHVNILVNLLFWENFARFHTTDIYTGLVHMCGKYIGQEIWNEYNNKHKLFNEFY